MPSVLGTIASRSATIVALCGAVACGDSAPSGRSSTLLQPTSRPLTTVAHLRGTVDVTTGTLSFEPVSASGVASSSGIDASIYGAQGVTIRLYNSAVVTSAPVAGKKTYTANVGIRNLLAYRIGDEQGSAAPADTMGIYVFTSTNPVVWATSSLCPTCAVTVKNRQGTLNFTATGQPYWYWPELLGPANGGADTTLARKQWVFEADTAVTAFSFDVLVSAAWVSPNDNVWRVEYPGDSLPDTQAEPRWRKFGTSKITTAMVGGYLELDVQRSKDSVVYVRRDSVSTTANAFMEARFRLDNGGNSPSAQAGIEIDDNTKYVALLVSDSSFSGRARVGFADGAGGFVTGGSDTVNVRALRAYQLRKYGADSVVAWVDGARRFKVAYTALPATRAASPLPSSFGFGIVATSSKNTTTTWNYVVYQIGQATP